jgi:hypothetical protein
LKAADLDFDYLERWAIEGSNRNEHWEQLDAQNTRVLHQRDAIKTFSINWNRDRFYRHVRLRQVGDTSHGNRYLNQTAIEFFGTLKRYDYIE